MSCWGGMGIAQEESFRIISVDSRTLGDFAGSIDLRHTWIVSLELSNYSDKPLVIQNGNLSIAIEGWLSNSRVPSHTTPSHYQVRVSDQSPVRSVSAGGNGQSDTCKERTSLWIGSKPLVLPKLGSGEERAFLPSHTISPGSSLYVLLTLEHDHQFYGAFDSLLGKRNVTITGGGLKWTGELKLDTARETYAPRLTWAAPLNEAMQGTRHQVWEWTLLLSGESGFSRHTYWSQTVKRDSSMQLSFWYWMKGTKSTYLTVAVNQFQRTQHYARADSCEPELNFWLKINNVDEFLPCGAALPPTMVEELKPLDQLNSSWQLKATGDRWVRVQKIVKINENANRAGLTFSLSGDENDVVAIDGAEMQPYPLVSENP